MKYLYYKFQRVRGLSGDLRRVGHKHSTVDRPDESSSKHNFSMRIQLLGYSGVLDDVGLSLHFSQSVMLNNN